MSYPRQLVGGGEALIPLHRCSQQPQLTGQVLIWTIVNIEINYLLFLPIFVYLFFFSFSKL